ncbi:MAG: M81 family metallopeptidase [Luteolibacter sp.]
MPRIAIGGIAIESCTFSPLTSGMEDFLVLRGEEMQARYLFMPEWKFQGREDIEWFPILQAKAIPGGSVQAEVYAALKAELLDGIRAVLPLDGFYFDIHGAMNVVGMDDAEADLARSIREVVGAGCLITTGMDLHGNVTPELVKEVDIFTAYREAPHIDYLDTREKACRLLLQCLDEGTRPVRAWARIPVGLPGERTSTFVEPGKSVYQTLKLSDVRPGILDASLWVGYVWADEPRTSATVVVTGTDETACREEAVRIARVYWDARRDFDFCVEAHDADTCIAKAAALKQKSVFISDSGDNPTAGGAGDIPTFIGRLLAHPDFASGDATAIYASMPDPAAVRVCYEAGVGARVSVSLGGKLDPVHAVPLDVEGEVILLSPADPIGGDLAVLRVGGVNIILTSRRKPFHVIREFTRLGLDPAEHELTVVKIGYLEPELHAAASHAFLALTAGAVNQDIPKLAFKRIRRPFYPLDDGFDPGDFEVTLLES